MTKKSELTKDEMKGLVRKMAVRISLLPFFTGLITFLPAGDRKSVV